MGHFYHQPLSPGSGRPALGCSLRCRWCWSTSHGPPQQATAPPADPFVLLASMEPQKKQLSWCECGNSMKFIMCFFVLHHAFSFFLLRFTLKGNHLMDCFAVFGYQCSLWWYTMIYTDILHVLIVLAHIRSICQFVYSQRIIPIGNSVGCFKSRWLCRYAGVFFADALRVFNQGCSILL
jgi:hypothetical protein